MKRVKKFVVAAMLGTMLFTSIGHGFITSTSYAEGIDDESNYASTAYVTDGDGTNSASTAYVTDGDGANSASTVYATDEAAANSASSASTIIEESDETEENNNPTSEFDGDITEENNTKNTVSSGSAYVGTSYDLKDFLKEAYVIDSEGNNVAVSDYSFSVGEEYELRLAFTENNDIQFGSIDDAHPYLTYALPEGVVPGGSNISGRFDITIVNQNGVYVLGENTYFFEDNILKVLINTGYTADGVNVYDIFQETTDAQFNLYFSIKVNEDVREIIFSDSVSGTVTEAEEVTTDDSDKKNEEDEKKDEDPSSGSDTLTVSKNFVEFNEDKTIATWKITVNVPKEGLDALSIKDICPTSYITTDGVKNRYVDTLESYSVSEYYSGDATPIEDSNVTFTAQSNNNMNITLSFSYTDEEGNVKEGIPASENGRQIVVMVNTKVNQEWVELVQPKHINTVRVTYKLIDTDNTKTKEVSATIYIYSQKQEMDKKIVKAELLASGTLRFKYSIVFRNINSSVLTFNDYYDTDIFDLDPASIVVTAGSNASAPSTVTICKGKSSKISVTEEVKETKYSSEYEGDPDYIGANGYRTITITDVDKDSNGNAVEYPYYLVTYNMTVSKANISKLQELANKGIITINGESVPGVHILNVATWNDLEDKNTDATYSYNGLAKTQINAPAATNNFTATFQLSINPAALDLSEDSDVLVLKDEADNLTHITSSIVVTTADGEDITDKCKVSLDAENALIIEIPDATALTITYDATVIASGQYTNKASLIGYTASTTQSCTFSSSGSGTASSKYIYIYKYDADDESKALEGAVFQLFEEVDGQLVVVTDINGDAVTITTDSNGKALLIGRYVTDGWSLKYDTQYYLKEIQAPEGYQLSKELVAFKLTEGTSNPVSKIYAVADTVSIANSKVKKEDPTPTDPSDDKEVTEDDTTPGNTETTTTGDNDSNTVFSTSTTVTTPSQDEVFFNLVPLGSVDNDEGAVLGARRGAETSDDKNTAARLMIILAASLVTCFLLISGKKVKH
ncbi:MAG: hypothetical protein IJV29_04510 [Butyrivibrio sp.]|nr:hypothetical protein [Butyrivibrio sp.]